MIKATLALAGVLLGGCSLTREVPPIQYYHFDTGRVVQAASERVCADRVVRIALIQAPDQLQDTSIYYSGADHKTYSYSLAQWEASPMDMLQQITEKSVIEGELFKAVIPYKSLAKNDWLLEVRMERMSQHIGDGDAARTELFLYAVVVDQYSRRIIDEKQFRYDAVQENGDVASAVGAWNDALKQFQHALNDWLQEQCVQNPKPDRSDVDL